MSLISALTCVPQGFAADFPKKYNLTEDEFERIQGLSALHLSSARSDLKLAEQATSEDKIDEDNELAEYNLEDYDDEPEDGEQMGIFNNIKGLAYHARGEDDPYITLNKATAESDEDDREDLQILPTDNIILAAKTEDDVSHLEVYVYEDDSSNLYVHHDILLPSFPLCLEWINYNPKTASEPTITGGNNNVAVGTFEPDIEIWDLDTVDALYPATILGAKPGTKRRKKRNDKYHVDAILGLSANPNAKNLLASASADETFKLWDLSSGTCAKSYSLHSDKVSAIIWNPKTPTILASGGYDQKTIVSDARVPDKAMHIYNVASDVENVSWDPFNENVIYTSTDDGVLFAHDIRNSKALWRIQAHDSTLSAFSVSSAAPGLIATGGQDKQLKLWSTVGEKPNMLTSRDFDIGKVFSLGFLPDKGCGMCLAAGGSNGIVRIWDTMTNPGVRKAFKSSKALAKATEHKQEEVPSNEPAVEERIIGVLDKDGPESDESDDENIAEDQESLPEGEDPMIDAGDTSSGESAAELEGDADFEGDEDWEDEDKH